MAKKTINKDYLAYYQELFESSPDFYFVINLKNGTILDCNENVKRYFEFKNKDEILNRPFETLLASYEKTKFHNLLEELGDRGEAQDREFELIRSKDRLFFTTLNVSCSKDEFGNSTIGHFVFRDAREIIRRREVEADLHEQMTRAEEAKNRIDELDAANTSMRQMQERLWQSERLATLGIVSANIGHEINNPLAIIKVIICSLKKKDKKGKLEKDDFFKAIEQLDSTAERIAQIVKGLKGMARNSAKDPLEWEDFNCLLSSVLDMCRQTHVASGVSILAEDVDDGIIFCRSGQLYQVLVNLINNGVQAVANSDESWVNVSTQVDGDYVKIFVKDSGNGIPSDIKDKIFKPLFTTKEKGKGTGLGLSICRDLVMSLEGDFYLDESCPNTCFVIKLKWRKREELAA